MSEDNWLTDEILELFEEKKRRKEEAEAEEEDTSIIKTKPKIKGGIISLGAPQKSIDDINKEMSEMKLMIQEGFKKKTPVKRATPAKKATKVPAKKKIIEKEEPQPMIVEEQIVLDEKPPSAVRTGFVSRRRR